MTRIASSHPAIWPDICVANRDAIVGALDDYLDELARVRAIVAGGDRAELLELLETARAARRNLPDRPPRRRGAGRAARPRARPRGRARRGHHAGRGAAASTSPTSRSRTRSRAAAVCSCSSWPSAGADAFEAALRRARATTSPRTSLVMSVPDELTVAGRAPAAGPPARPRRQGHLAPRAAVRGDGRRPLARRRPRRRRRRRPARGACSTQLGVRDHRRRLRRSPSTAAASTGSPSRADVARLRQLGHHACARSTGLLAGRPFLSVLIRRRVARAAARCAGSSSRCGRWARTSTAAPTARSPPLAVDGGDLVGCAHALAVASAQVKTALVLAGLQADGTTEITEPAPEPRPHRADARGARRAGRRGRRHAPCASPRARRPVRARRARRPVVGRVLGRRRRRSRPGPTSSSKASACNPTRIAFVDVLRRMGADDRGRAHRRAARRAGGRPARRRVAAARHDHRRRRDRRSCGRDPALAVAAAFADGVTEIRDAGELRVKESDRIATVEALLARVGVGVESGADALVDPRRAPARGAARQPRRPPHRHGGRDRGQRDRRRVRGRRLARGRGLVPRVHRRPRHLTGHGAPS